MRKELQINSVTVLENLDTYEIILATLNLPYPAWQDFLGNRPLTHALLCRLRK